MGAGAAIWALQGGLIMQAFGHYAVLLERDFGWSKTTFAAAFSFNRAESGLLGPAQGWALNRYGPRALLRVGAVVMALGFVLFSQIRTPAQFIGAFIVVSVGAGLSGFLTLTTEVVRWFERKRARALSLLTVGVAVGGLATPGVVWVLRTIGWRGTALASAVVVLVVILPLARLYGRNPADVGQEIDGGDAATTAPTGSARAKGVSDVHFTAAEAVRTRAFWMLSLGHASALLVVGPVLAHLSLYLTSERGLTLQEAGFIAAGLTLCQLLGSLAGGVLGDWMSKRLLASASMLGHMSGLLLLAFASGPLMIWLFVVLHGFSWGLRGPMMNALRADYFGASAFGQIMGFSSLIVMIGVVGGPLLAGFLADVTGSYRTGFTILALLAGSGVTFFALASPPAPPVRQPSPELVSR